VADDGASFYIHIIERDRQRIDVLRYVIFARRLVRATETQ